MLDILTLKIIIIILKYIVGELSGRLFANYSTPQAKKRGQNSKQIEDLVQERRNAKNI